MSIGLAIRQIGKYTADLQTLNELVAAEEGAHIRAVGDSNDNAVRDSLVRIGKLKTLISMITQFLEFWKDIIKQMLGIMKMFNELATGGGR